MQSAVPVSRPCLNVSSPLSVPCGVRQRHELARLDHESLGAQARGARGDVVASRDRRLGVLAAPGRDRPDDDRGRHQDEDHVIDRHPRRRRGWRLILAGSGSRFAYDRGRHYPVRAAPGVGLRTASGGSGARECDSDSIAGPSGRGCAHCWYVATGGSLGYEAVIRREPTGEALPLASGPEPGARCGSCEYEHARLVHIGYATAAVASHAARTASPAVITTPAPAPCRSPTRR